MTKLAVTETELASVQQWIAARPELSHVRVRRRGDLLVLESGPRGGAAPHTRLRRIGARRWTLEMPLGKRWQPTGVRAALEVILRKLSENSSWMLTPLD